MHASEGRWSGVFLRAWVQACTASRIIEACVSATCHSAPNDGRQNPRCRATYIAPKSSGVPVPVSSAFPSRPSSRGLACLFRRESHDPRDARGGVCECTGDGNAAFGGGAGTHPRCGPHHRVQLNRRRVVAAPPGVPDGCTCSALLPLRLSKIIRLLISRARTGNTSCCKFKIRVEFKIRSISFHPTIAFLF